MEHISKAFSISSACCLVAVGVVLAVFPGAPVCATLLQLMGIWVIVRYAYGKLCPATAAGGYILLATLTLLGIGMALNTWYFTTYSGGTLTAPVLYNNDAATVWSQLKAISGGYGYQGLRMARYAHLLSWIGWGGEPTINSLIINNIIAVMLTIVLTGAFTAQICGAGDDAYRRRISTVAMGMMAAVCYFIVTGVIIIKDAMMCLSMATALYGLSLLTNGQYRCRPWLLLAVAGVATWLVRPHMLPFIVMAMLIFSPFMARRKWIGVAIVAIAIGALYLESLSSSFAAEVFKDDGTSAVNIHLGTSKRLAAYEAVAPAYESMSVWERALRLPFSLAVQYLTPLPWAFGRDTIFGPAQAYAHVSYPWYIVGGIALFYVFRCLLRSPRLLAAAAVFGVCATVATAFATGGTISRYCLPWLPALVPGAAWVIASGRWRKRDFRIWSAVYGITLIVGLVIVFIALGIYSPGGWDAR